MKATYNPTAKTSFTTSHRKEGKCFFRSMQVISLKGKPWPDGRLHPVIDCRLYGTGKLNTCCIWVYKGGEPVSDRVCTSGSGKAGGYGYHRPSAAMTEAVRNAGFTLDKDIGGVGETAMREALLAMAKAIGVKSPAIIESYP